MTDPLLCNIDKFRYQFLGTVSKNEIAVTFCVDIQKLMYIIKTWERNRFQNKTIQGEEKWERTMSIWKYQNRS